MPELAEVEFYRKQWNPGLNQKILSVDLHSKKRVFRGQSTTTLRHKVIGETFHSSHAHGKQMLFRFGQNTWLGIHLGMTGTLSAQPASYSAARHDHLILRTKKHSLVFCDPRLFGRIRFHFSRRPPDWWSQLPTPLLSKDFDIRKLMSICHRRRKTPLKALLLRQECFPGVGNWMADEILWQTRLDPKMTGGCLNPLQIQKLHLSVRKICREAIRRIGRDWSNPPKSWLFHRRWKPGGQCPRCHQSLARDTVGGRTTCWCPVCQPPLPRRAKAV